MEYDFSQAFPRNQQKWIVFVGYGFVAHTCPIQLHMEITAASHRRHKVSYGVPLSLRTLAVFVQGYAYTQVKETLCDL